jgi:CheY-like chemotaxis protein
MQSASKHVVLVVEDEPLLRLLAAESLVEVGYEVVEAADAGAALKVLQTRGDVELIFTDIHMPGALDGLGLARTVNTRWPRIRLLLTSGRERPSQGAIPEEGRFIEKPYTPSDLLRNVANLLPPASPTGAAQRSSP